MHVPFCLNVFVPYSRMRALNLIIPSLFQNEGLQLNYSFLVLDRYFSCFKLGFLSHKCYREGILKSQKRRYATAPPPESVRGGGLIIQLSCSRTRAFNLFLRFSFEFFPIVPLPLFMFCLKMFRINGTPCNLNSLDINLV